MVTLKGGIQAWWIVVIILIFAAIGLVVFILRKKIPGLTNYDKKSEEEEANDNVNSMLSSLEEEQKIKDLNKPDPNDDEE